MDYHALGDKRRQETSALDSDYPSAWLRTMVRPKDADFRAPGLGLEAQTVLPSAIPRGASGAHSHTPVQSMGDTVRRGRTGYTSDTFPLASGGGSVDDLYQCYRSSTRENRGADGIPARGPLSVSLPQHSLTPDDPSVTFDPFGGRLERGQACPLPFSEGRRDGTIARNVRQWEVPSSRYPPIAPVDVGCDARDSLAGGSYAQTRFAPSSLLPRVAASETTSRLPGFSGQEVAQLREAYAASMRGVRSSPYDQPTSRAAPSATFVPSASDVVAATTLDRTVPLLPPSRRRLEEPVCLAQSSVRAGGLPRQAPGYTDLRDTVRRGVYGSDTFPFASGGGSVDDPYQC